MTDPVGKKLELLQLSFITIIVGFAFFFYLVTPLRLFFYWKIPLLEDNVTTLIWVLPVLAFYPIYQFFRDTNSKRLVQLVLIFLPLLFLGEVKGKHLVIEGCIDLPLAKIKKAWCGGLGQALNPNH